MSNTGKLKWFNAKKGYGFITTSEGKDVFLHISDLQASGIESLQEGEGLTFDIGENRGKEKAVNVKQTDGEASAEAPAEVEAEASVEAPAEAEADADAEPTETKSE